MKVSKKIKLLDFKLTKSIGGALFGIYKSRFHGSGIDFMEHKEYHFGDPIKYIDWKASAKSANIYSKVFEEERDLEVLFLIDTHHTMFFQLEERTKKDILEEMYYCLAFSAYKNGDSIATQFFGGQSSDFLPYRRDITNIFETIDRIEKLQIKKINREKRCYEILKKLQKDNTKNKLIFLLTDDSEMLGCEKLLSELSIKNEIVCIHIFDFFENHLTSIASSFFLGDGTSFLDINMGDKKKKDAFVELRAKKLEHIKKNFQKKNMQYLKVDTRQNIFQELVLAFKK